MLENGSEIVIDNFQFTVYLSEIVGLKNQDQCMVSPILTEASYNFMPGAKIDILPFKKKANVAESIKIQYSGSLCKEWQIISALRNFFSSGMNTFKPSHTFNLTILGKLTKMKILSAVSNGQKFDFTAAKNFEEWFYFKAFFTKIILVESNSVEHDEDLLSIMNNNGIQNLKLYGCEQAIQGFQRIIDLRLMNNYNGYIPDNISLSMPSVIIYGPKGSGKTTLVKIIAHRNGIRFNEIKIQDLIISKTPEIKEKLLSRMNLEPNQKIPTILFIKNILDIKSNEILTLAIHEIIDLLSTNSYKKFILVGTSSDTMHKSLNLQKKLSLEVEKSNLIEKSEIINISVELRTKQNLRSQMIADLCCYLHENYQDHNSHITDVSNKVSQLTNGFSGGDLVKLVRK
ncbi:MAG: hypothetical protein MHPSP_002153, partial [Paramarteilia canceri]